MDKKGVMLLFFLVFLNGCSNIVDNSKKECVTNSDCVPAGCSSQLCAPISESDGIITTCEYKEEYACLEFSSCGCVENKCQWADSKEYIECLEEVRV